MARGVLSGLGYGAVVSVLGLAGVSLMLPPPQPARDGMQIAAAPDPRSAPPRLPTPGVSADPATPVPAPPAHPPVVVPEPVPPVAAVPGPGPQPVEAPAGPDTPEAGDGPALAVQPAPPPRVALAPGAPPAAAPDAAASAATAPAARPQAAMPAPQAQPVPETAPAALSEPPRAEAPIPVAPPGAVATPALVPAAPAPEVPDPAASAPVPRMTVSGAGRRSHPQEEAILDPVGEPEPEVPLADPAPRQTGFANAPGVRVGRLPSIGTDPAPAAEEPPPGDLPPLQAFAQPFEAAAGQPLLSVVLVDPGVAAGGLDFATLSTIAFPLTIAIDPTRADAAQAAADYRAAGFEVAILAASLPAGATPSDLEVAVGAWRAVIPQAVAVVEPAAPVVQNSRALAQQLVRILDREGLALVTQAQGLNAAAQIARGGGVPQASVWKVLDGNREDAASIARSLERAAFEATRGGSLTVMLSGWPKSVTGLLRWQPDAARDLALAPVSAVVRAGPGN